MSALRVFVIAGTAAGRQSVTDAIREAGAEVTGSAADVRYGVERLRASPHALVTVARSSCPDAGTLGSLLRAHQLETSVLIHADESAESVRAEVLPTVRVLMRRHALSPGGSGVVQMVAIGASTGGPVAIQQLLTMLRGPLNVPILIVQHMPVGFTGPFAERLTRQCGIPVREAVTGAVPRAGEAWLAPADHHMVLKRTDEGMHLITHRGPPENSCRPAVDVLFRSVAEACGSRGLGVVLTGMGQDGLIGARQMSGAGAAILVQDEASSVIWGMPGAIAKAGIATRILPLEPLAAEILARVPPPPRLPAPSRPPSSV
jgi:chemotaxis response regulator CheB